MFGNLIGYGTSPPSHAIINFPLGLRLQSLDIHALQRGPIWGEIHTGG